MTVKSGTTLPDFLRSPKFLVLALAAVALTLRLYRLGTYSVWTDEEIYVLCYKNAFNFSRHALTYQLINPVPIVLASWVWGLFGSSDWWLRLLPALAGVATVPAIYMMARQFTDKWTAVICSAVVTFSPLDIYYSQTFRRDAIWIFTIVVSLYYLGRALQHGKRRDFVLYTFWAAVNLLIMPFCAALYAVVGLCVIVDAWKSRLYLRRWVVVNLFLFLLTVEHFMRVYVVYGSIQEPIGANPDVLSAARTLKTFFFGYHLPDELLWPAVVFAALLYLYSIYLQARYDRRLFMVATLSTLTVIAAIVAGVFLRQEMFVIRYFAFLLPLIFFLLAYVLRRLPSPYVTGAVLGVLLFFTGLSTAGVYRNAPIAEREMHQRKDYRGVADFIVNHKRDGDMIGHYHRSSFMCTEKYIDGGMKNKHLLFRLPECAKSNEDNRYVSFILAPLGMADVDAEIELARPENKRVWMVFSEWQPDKPIYNPSHHTWRRTPPEAAFDWLLQHYRLLPFEDEGRMVTRKTFDGDEWFCLFLFDLTRKP